jgi:hypothetical protein
MRLKLIGSACALVLAGALAGCTPTAVAPATTAAAPHMGGSASAAPTYRGAAGGAAPGEKEKPKLTSPPPLVQNCAVVSISTPSRYACNGKTYTTFQLTKIRTDYATKGYWQEP